MHTPTDLSSLSDDELNELIENARQILSRRAATALIPTQIEGLAREYRESGGDQSTLEEAITGAPPAEAEETDAAQYPQDEIEEN